jgi:hypothetical protein
VHQPSFYSFSARQDGVSIGLEPLEDVQDQLTYFHSALTPRGFLPVFVVIHNDSKVDSLLFDSSGISYGLDSSSGVAPKQYTGGQKAGMAVSAAIPFAGPYIFAGIAEEASEVRQNLMLQELQSATLSPGSTVHGFLYIPVPKKGQRPKIRVQFPLAWAGSDQTSVVHIDF